MDIMPVEACGEAGGLSECNLPSTAVVVRRKGTPFALVRVERAPGAPIPGYLRASGRMVLRALKELARDERGQVMAEYSILMWFFTLIGVAALTTFFFAFEEGVIGYYEDIVNVICLPIP